jgi:hypothetical protein
MQLPEMLPLPDEVRDQMEEIARVFFECARYERPSTDWRQIFDEFVFSLLSKQSLGASADAQEVGRE